MNSSSSDPRQDALLLRRQGAAALQSGAIARAHHLLSLAKALRVPVPSLDYLRALTFLKAGDMTSAREAAKEELRFFPDCEPARALLDQLAGTTPVIDRGDEHFRALCTRILPYTMVGIPRLHALYIHAEEICRNGPQGSFVECGVAGGGSSGLLSAVIQRCSPARRLFSCDSFHGMPPATAEDAHAGHTADSTGWGAGTCAAPESSVIELCRHLGTLSVLTTVKGYFEDTLPLWKDRFGSIAFLHMDGDWYSSTKAILDNLYDSLATGAYVQVDDYGHWEGCRKAVAEFFDGRGLPLSPHPIDGTGVWFQKS